jgi:hypothetical protein
MSKKKTTKHKATVERTTLLFFFPKTEKHQRSQSLRKQWNVHTRGELASERERERQRERQRERREDRPVTNPSDQGKRNAEGRAGASVVFLVELQTLVTGGWICTRFLGETCEFMRFGGRCIICLSLWSAFTDSATFCGRIIQRAQFKLSLRGCINFFVGSELV